MYICMCTMCMHICTKQTYISGHRPFFRGRGCAPEGMYVLYRRRGCASKCPKTYVCFVLNKVYLMMLYVLEKSPLNHKRTVKLPLF